MITPPFQQSNNPYGQPMNNNVPMPDFSLVNSNLSLPSNSQLLPANNNQLQSYNNQVAINNQIAANNQLRLRQQQLVDEYNQSGKQEDDQTKKQKSLIKELGILGALGALKGGLLNWGVQTLGKALSPEHKDLVIKTIDKIPEPKNSGLKFMKSIYIDPHVEGFKSAVAKGSITWTPIMKEAGITVASSIGLYLVYRGAKYVINKFTNKQD